MTANDLGALFQDWRETTRAEGEAIANGRWADVAEHQQHKRDLQQKIVATTDAWQRTWTKTGETQADYERQFRPMLCELIALEAKNASLLERMRSEAEAERNRLDHTVKNLRGVQRAYGHGNNSHWVSYS